MNILFMDGVVERHLAISNNKDVKFCSGICIRLVGEHRIYHCTTAEATISCLKTKVYDVVYLDHDMGEGKTSGMEVVRFIVEMKNKPKKVIVHSMNTPMAEKMVAELRSYDIDSIHLPFSHMIN